jgi:hypothetical protein
MATQGEIKLLARLTAAETLIQHLLFMVASTKPDPVAELKAYRERLLAEYSKVTMRGFDPASSDLLAQELTEALDNLLSVAIARAQGSPPGRRSSQDT